MNNNELMRLRIAKAVKRNPIRPHCPLCGTTNLLNVFPDQFCMECDWDSVLGYVLSGKMHDLNQAYFEHFIFSKIVSQDAAPSGETKQLTKQTKTGRKS